MTDDTDDLVVRACVLLLVAVVLGVLIPAGIIEWKRALNDRGPIDRHEVKIEEVK